MSTFASNSYSLPTHVAGFTLVELLISITVLAVLLALTVPSFKNTLMNNRVLAQTDALTNALGYARNVALSQNINVLACPANTPGSTACGTHWNNGWIIVGQPTNGPAVLLQANFSGVNNPVLSTVPIGGVAAASVTFDPRGIATTQANFKLCDSRGGAFARSVRVLPTGFIQSSPTMGVAAWDGSDLTCP
jgi:type IV fimbrial biogenesis protein FimT